MKEVTIQDIARVAGVSKSTVSRVLNGTAAVNMAKKKAVLEATKRLGFKPNIVARSLARGRSMTIGVMTQLIGSPFYDTVAQGVIAGLQGTHYSPLFVDGQWQRSDQLEAIRALVGRRVDGLVLIGGDISSEEIVEHCGELPTVFVSRHLEAESHRCVYTDNVKGGYHATKYLIDKGHQNIAIICGLEHHPDAVDRLKGYQMALKEANLPINLNLVLSGDFSAGSGADAINSLVASSEPFTAVFAANDLTAFGARLALDRHGFSVPDNVSLIGFDDQMESAYTTPPLTTVRQPAKIMGELGVKGILKLIHQEPFSSISVSGDLIERESVKQI